MCGLMSACDVSQEKRVTWFQAPGEAHVGFLIRVLINALAIYFTVTKSKRWLHGLKVSSSIKNMGMEKCYKY
jgi:hypothetical protein